jgi:hypothetical protein
VYHFVQYAPSVVACISTRIQVPAGVVAVHEDTSSVNPKPVENAGDVQRAYE